MSIFIKNKHNFLRLKSRYQNDECTFSIIYYNVLILNDIKSLCEA